MGRMRGDNQLSRDKAKDISMNLQVRLKKTNWKLSLRELSRVFIERKAFFKVKNEGWEKVDVVGKKLDYAPYEAQEKSELVFISKIGIALDPGD